jgi:RNA-directed DNA polymerase
MSQSSKRQELYDRIRQSSKQEVILEEMIRLGFWPREGEIPDDPADEIRRRAEIRNELDVLRTEQNRLKNTEAMLREVRKQRMADSRRRQQETRERRERERIERARAWKSRQDREIVYLGEEVSGGLAGREVDNARLEAQGLLLLQTPEAIADFIGISINTLRFITYNRKVSSEKIGRHATHIRAQTDSQIRPTQGA